jgi:hypothetical protein
MCTLALCDIKAQYTFYQNKTQEARAHQFVNYES